MQAAHRFPTAESRRTTGPVVALRPEETAVTAWDPWLTGRHLVPFCWRDARFVESLWRLAPEGRVIVTTHEDAFLRRFTVGSAERRGEGVVVSLNQGEYASHVPVLTAGQDIRLSWFDDGHWYGARAHVDLAGRTTAVLDVPRHGWRFPLMPDLFDQVMSTARLFPGFDATLGRTDNLHALNHPFRVQEMLTAAQSFGRPALVFIHAIGVFVTGRFSAREVEAGIRTGAKRPITLDLRSADLGEQSWRAGLQATVSSVVNGQIVAFRTRVAGGRGATLELERPEMYFRWDRRTRPRVPVGNRAGHVLQIPVLDGPGGARPALVRAAGVVDVSTRGMAFVVDARSAQRLALETHAAQLELGPRRDIVLPMQVLDTRPAGDDDVLVSATFQDLDARADHEITQWCARLSGTAKANLQF